MGKLLWKGREKGLPCWLSLFSKTKLRQPTGQTFFLSSHRNFHISFQPKIAIEKFVWKMQKQVWYYKKWVGHHASFPPRWSVKIPERFPPTDFFINRPGHSYLFYLVEFYWKMIEIQRLDTKQKGVRETFKMGRERSVNLRKEFWRLQNLPKNESNF